MIGGVLGALLGTGATMGLGHALGWGMTPSPLALSVAVGTSALIGLTFVLARAHGSEARSIEALRVE